MKETLEPQQFQVDPNFDPSDSTMWPAPVAGEHVNILNVDGYQAEMPSGQAERVRDLRVAYFARETELGWRSMSEVLDYNLGLLEHVVDDDSGESGNGMSLLMLSTLDMLDDRAMNQGHDMRFAGQYSPIALRNASGEEFPEQTQTMLHDLYDITGARVFRDDRNSPDEKSYRRYLIGNYNGKQLMFIEQSIVPNYKPGPERQFMVSVTGDMDRLKELSQDEVHEVLDYVGVGAYLMRKDILPGVRAMIDQSGAEIEEITNIRPKSK